MVAGNMVVAGARAATLNNFFESLTRSGYGMQCGPWRDVFPGLKIVPVFEYKIETQKECPVFE
jgi:hypothetical protein